ncbi:MAG: hypothetical protein ACPG44_02075 [Polaribacter sp.]
MINGRITLPVWRVAMIELNDSEATVVWAGTHQEYETTFKNNRNTIRKWLKFNA